MNKLLALCCILYQFVTAQPQSSYWQQQANYAMDVEVNTKKFTYTGKQEITYTNNSEDSLDKVFFHLYFNAFQPNSEMDMRSRTIKDADKRVASRIEKLNEKEIGFLKVNTLTLEGKKVDYKTVGTILEVSLKAPILPNSTVHFQMDFNGQVPKQIRRSGRKNAEGVALSMTQWYPKIAAYDNRGWHANPYIAREFYAPFGNYDVKLTLDATYTIGGTGVLQNPEAIGHGYQGNTIGTNKEKKIQWHFKAEDVHDFAWAADTKYVHDVVPFGNNQKMHFLYKNNTVNVEKWKRMQPLALKLMAYYETHIGPYPYPQYSIIQGGDGGMEYAMCTLITGNRKFDSLVGVTAHEMAHAWFQHILATDEANYEWMDEGFTTYISTLAEAEVMKTNKTFPNEGSYKTYYQLAGSGVEQPQTTHADRYKYNFAYGASAYAKGAVFLDQLGYVIGTENLEKTITEYYSQWKFKHPKPNDFIRIAEKISGLELDWYLNDWTTTTNTIDYGVATVEATKKETEITLERKGLMPMPIEVEVVFNDETKQQYYIPLQMLRGEKPVAEGTTILPDWAWAFPTYRFKLETKKTGIKLVRVNPTKKMADMNALNDSFTVK